MGGKRKSRCKRTSITYLDCRVMNSRVYGQRNFYRERRRQGAAISLQEEPTKKDGGKKKPKRKEETETGNKIESMPLKREYNKCGHYPLL